MAVGKHKFVNTDEKVFVIAAVGGAAARFETVIGFSFVFISFERRFGRCGKELESRCSSNVL
jgi:hypothetical protein